LTFEVVDFLGIYHALLGRPCFSKFTAVLNYTYFKLKMPSPKGDITIEGSFEQAYYCEQDHITQAATLMAPCALDSPGRDIGRALAKKVAKVVVVLNHPRVTRQPRLLAAAMAWLAPPIRRSAPRRG